MVVDLHGANPQVGLRVHKVGFKGTYIAHMVVGLHEVGA